MDESYLKQYVRQQREKRTGSPAKIAPVSGRGSGVRSTQPAPTNRDSGSDSGQNPKIEHSQLAEGRFARADVQRGIDAQKSVQATRESGGRVVGAVKNQGEEVVGSIRLLGVKLTTALEENNSKLLRSIDKLTNAVRFSGGGGGLFDGPSLDRGRDRGRGRGRKPSKMPGLKIAGGALVGGVLGHYAGAEGARMLGFDEDTAETAGTVGSVAGSVLGGVVMTEGGRKGVARAGQAIVRNPGAAGAVVAGGYAAYQGAKNVSTLTDSGADTADRIRAGSHLALSGVGGFIGSRLGGAQGAAYGAAAGDFVADTAESLGSVLNDAISGTTIGDAIQTGIGTGIDALLSPFSADARDRLGKTFGSVADSASAAAAGVVGSVSAFGRQAADVYDSAVSRVGGLTVGAGEAVMAAVGAGSQLFSEGLASSAVLFQEGITSSLTPAITAAAGMISSSVVNFQNWYAGFGDTFDQLASDLGRNFDEFADGASMLARSTWAGLKAGAGKVEQAAKEGYNNAQPKPAAAAAAPAVTTSQTSATPFGSRDKPQAPVASADTAPVPAAREKPAVKQSVLDKAANVARGVAGAVVSGAAAVPGAAAEVKRVAAPGVQAGLTQMKSGVAGGVGSIAEFFESGGRGVNTISTGKGDHGGVSYGKHQLASKNGSMATFLKSKEAAQFSSQFAGLTPGSKEFNDAYAKLASGENSSDFAKAQKQYIDRTHFEPTKNNVTESTGIDIANRSKALNEAVYSTSVQYGAGGGSSLLKKAWKDLGPDADDATLISKLQDYKQANVDTNFKSSSADMRAGVAKRAGQEKEMLLRVLEAEKTGSSTEKETKNKWVKKQDEAIKQAAGLVPKAGSDSQVAAAPAAGTVQPTQVASTQREKTAQELNPHLFKQTQTTPMSPLRDTALTGSGGSQSVKVAEAAKSYHLSPLARSRSAAGNSQPSAVDSLASARPTEFEKIREKPALTQQVEIANFPEQKDEQASMQQAPAIIAGKGPPMLDEIPLIISDMGLVLLQMGHT